MDDKNTIDFIQQNYPDGGFLQSEEWMKFQESAGRKTHSISTLSVLRAPYPYKGEGNIEFYASVVEHTLPIVGKYFYIPRGPVMKIPNPKSQIQNKSQNPKSEIKNQLFELIKLAKKNRAGWIRVEPVDEKVLEAIRIWTSDVQTGPKICGHRMSFAKAPHDMQPKEIFVINITKIEEQLLTEMKAKTRYNIKVAQKHGVSVRVVSRLDSGSGAGITKYINEFIRLTQVMAKRQGIEAHPDSYYRKMFEIIPGDILKLYVAEYKGKMIAANLVVFYGETCTYLHGASDDSFRNVMAPHLLQWSQIQDAKKAGCKRYDFGGVKTGVSEQGAVSSKNGNWQGITRFKLGFSLATKPIEFPGCYDIIVSPVRYWVYRAIQRIKVVIKLISVKCKV